MTVVKPKKIATVDVHVFSPIFDNSCSVRQPKVHQSIEMSSTVPLAIFPKAVIEISDYQASEYTHTPFA